jgi:hypothetical protein
VAWAHAGHGPSDPPHSHVRCLACVCCLRMCVACVCACVRVWYGDKVAQVRVEGSLARVFHCGWRACVVRACVCVCALCVGVSDDRCSHAATLPPQMLLTCARGSCLHLAYTAHHFFSVSRAPFRRPRPSRLPTAVTPELRWDVHQWRTCCGLRCAARPSTHHTAMTSPLPNSLPPSHVVNVPNRLFERRERAMPCPPPIFVLHAASVCCVPRFHRAVIDVTALLSAPLI